MTIGEDVGRAVPRNQFLDSVIAFKTDTRNDVAGVMFLREVQGRGLKHLDARRVLAKGSSMEVLGELADLIERTHGGDDEEDGKSWLLRHDDGDLTLVSVGDGWASVDS